MAENEEGPPREPEIPPAPPRPDQQESYVEEPTPTQEEIQRELARGSEFERDLAQTFDPYFQDEKDLEILKILYSPDDFYKFVENKQKELERRSREQSLDWSSDEIARRASVEVERDITLLFSKIYRGVDTSHPEKFFEEIKQEGFLQSISLADLLFRQRLEQLIEKLSRTPRPEGLEFYTRYTDQFLGTAEKGDKTFNRYRVIPTPKSKQVRTAEEFLRSVKNQLINEEHARSFQHNVQVLFKRKPKEGESFWAQLSSYAEQFGSTDIDALMSLPDADIFMAVNRLYQKYLEDDFAKVDWIHQSNMFSKDLFDLNNPIIQRVIEDLRRLFPEFKEISVDDWRLRRAVSMGVGIARGVYLNEVETAAWADPSVTYIDGRPTYQSYYTNDNAALTTLNPAHHFLRWQSESVTRGGLIFLLTEGFDPSQHRIWDHAQILERIKYFRDSFENGRPPQKNPLERMFFELMPNIGRVGSIVTRGGWRTEAAIDGWLKRVREIPLKDLEAFQRGEIKDAYGWLTLLDSWKSIENIGYEALAHFTQNKLLENDNRDFFLSNDPQVSQMRNEFLEYVYSKYINPGLRPGETLGSYLSNIRTDAESTIDDLVREGKIPRDERDAKVTQELYQKFMHRALAGVLRQRLPTKFIRIERNRLSKDGMRAWQKLKIKKGWTESQMDEAMKNLSLVEVKLRQKSHDEMVDGLIAQGDNPDLSTIPVDDYFITEMYIQQVLTEAGIDSADAIDLFKEINQFLDKDGYIDEFADKLRTKDAEGNARTRDFPFALAAEELDTTFLAWRASGDSPLARALGDTAAVEQHVTGQIQAYFDLLEQVALDPKRDISELVKRLKDMKYTLEKIHDIGTSTQVAYRIASLTIGYFKKDTLARNIFTKWFRFGRKNSLAAEFTGAYRGVWEWEVADIDNFVTEMERWNILPKEPFDKMRTKVEPRFSFSLFGKEFNLGKKVLHEPAYKYSGGILREQFGATKKHILLELMNKYLPLIMLIVLWQSISRAAKEELQGKR